MEKITKRLHDGWVVFDLPHEFSDFAYFDSFVSYISDKMGANVVEKIEVADVYDYRLEIAGEKVVVSAGDPLFLHLKNLTRKDGGILNALVPQLNLVIETKEQNSKMA